MAESLDALPIPYHGIQSQTTWFIGLGEDLGLDVTGTPEVAIRGT